MPDEFSSTKIVFNELIAGVRVLRPLMKTIGLAEMKSFVHVGMTLEAWIMFF